MGFLDPQKTYFGLGKSGKCFSSCLLQTEYKDQLLPFHRVFGCDLSTTEAYNGTLFRFPLRQKPSKLSDKEYTETMIDNLFASLREEASVILLFLKNVQSIGVYKRSNNSDDNERIIFNVKVVLDTAEDVPRKRQELLKKAKNVSSPTQFTWLVNIHVEIADKTSIYRWLVVNQLGSTNRRILELSSKLYLLPWVGLALQVGTGEMSGKGSTKMDEYSVFCLYRRMLNVKLVYQCIFMVTLV